jgi:hypothetical protein
MNTPDPCCTCEELYYDAMKKNDPSYCSECKLGLPMGLADCRKYDPDPIAVVPDPADVVEFA